MPVVSNAFGSFGLLLSLKNKFLNTVQKKVTHYLDKYCKNSPYHGNTAYNVSSSIYRNWGDLQSIYLKCLYLEHSNRSCSMLSCFFSLSYYLTKNIARLNYKNNFFDFTA